MKTHVKHREVVLAFGTDNTHTPAFKIPKSVMFMGVLVPNITDGAVGIEISIDKGGNYYPLIDSVDGADVEIMASGSNPGWIDFSDFLRFIHPEALVRFVIGAEQSADHTFTLLFKG